MPYVQLQVPVLVSLAASYLGEHHRDLPQNNTEYEIFLSLFAEYVTRLMTESLGEATLEMGATSASLPRYRERLLETRLRTY